MVFRPYEKFDVEVSKLYLDFYLASINFLNCTEHYQTLESFVVFVA